MLKVMVTVNRKPGMDVEAFHEEWRTRSSRACRGMPDDAPPLRRYIQNHTLLETYQDEEPPYDGLSELWFDDMQSFQDWFDHPHYRDEIYQAEKEFIDLGAVQTTFTHEIQMDVQPTEPDMVKVYWMMVRRSDLSFEEFDRFWSSEHVHEVMQTDTWKEYVRHYTQNHVNQAAHPEGAPFDGIATVWLDDVQQLEEWRQTEAVQEEFPESQDRFLDRDRLEAFVTRPHFVI